MGKIKKQKQVLSKEYDRPITWGDFKDKLFEDDDVFTIQYIEPFYSDNNSYDGGFGIEVIRMVEETDEEYNKRISDEERYKLELKERRYQNYLKLKKEFDEIKGDDKG